MMSRRFGSLAFSKDLGCSKRVLERSSARESSGPS
jgi:hypothetical protein